MEGSGEEERKERGGGKTEMAERREREGERERERARAIERERERKRESESKRERARSERETLLLPAGVVIMRAVAGLRCGLTSATPCPLFNTIICCSIIQLIFTKALPAGKAAARWAGALNTWQPAITAHIMLIGLSLPFAAAHERYVMTLDIT